MVDDSGITELKLLRDLAAFIALPPPPKLYFTWNPNNAGPLYFLICLTLGVVIPSLRCARRASCFRFWGSVLGVVIPSLRHKWQASCFRA